MVDSHIAIPLLWQDIAVHEQGYVYKTKQTVASNLCLKNTSRMLASLSRLVLVRTACRMRSLDPSLQPYTRAQVTKEPMVHASALRTGKAGAIASEVWNASR